MTLSTMGRIAVLSAAILAIGGAVTGSLQASGHLDEWPEPEPPSLCEGDMTAELETGLPLMESRLDLTIAQEPAWRDLAAAIGLGAMEIDEACRASEPEQATAPARLTQTEVMLDTSLAAIRRMRPALDALYDILDAEQRSTLDDMLEQLMPGGSSW